MKMRPSSRSAWFRVAVLVVSLVGGADAQSKDAEAFDIQAQALSQAWEGFYPQAVTKLRRAIKICRRGECSPDLLARIYGDLGVIYVLQNQLARAKASFEAGLKLDPGLRLEGQLVTDEALKLFGMLGGARQLELLHEPVLQQLFNYPVPIYAELNQPDVPASASVFYRGETDPDWRTERMQPHGSGYAAYIPCTATRQPGPIWYYVAAGVGTDRPPLTTAPLEQPHVVQIVAFPFSPEPHLPNSAAPGACPECFQDADCGAGRRCRQRRCIQGAGGPGAAAEGLYARKSVWLGLAFVQELSSASNAEPCAKESQLSSGFSCFRPQGSQYHGTPLTTSTAGGFTATAGRAILLSEIGLAEDMTLGMRVGYALYGGAPRSDGGAAYLPFFGEARVSYWLGPGAFANETAFFVFASGGVAEVDPSYAIEVTEDTSVPPPPSQLDNPTSQTLTAYKRMGSMFGAGGGGVFLPLGRESGILADGKLMVLFPSSGFAVALGAGVAFGL